MSHARRYHVDYSARVQTVHQETNPRFHALLSAFKARTGCPVLVNTSFNVRGEPIVCTPEDAFRCFMGTELDALAIGNLYLIKSEWIRPSDTTTGTLSNSTEWQLDQVRGKSHSFFAIMHRYVADRAIACIGEKDGILIRVLELS